MAKLKAVLEKELTSKELAQIRGSFDIIGNIVLIEIPDELQKKEKLIGRTILVQNSAIKTVLKKVGGHVGQYRTQKTKFLAGIKTKEVLHKENGVLMKINVGKCYFSPRLSAERMRIAQMIKQDEIVLVMFSGVAPYPLVIAKHSPAKLVVGVEKNPVAHEYALQNLTLNKIPKEKIILYCGDVRKKVPLLKQKFNRIIMPLPKTGEQFLDVAFKVIKKNGVIQLYQFANENEFGIVGKKILDFCKNKKKKCKIVNISKAGQNAPRNYRIRVDIQVK